MTAPAKFVGRSVPRLEDRPLLLGQGRFAADAEVDHGIAAVERAVYGTSGAKPRTPFFRFPGFASSPALLDDISELPDGPPGAGVRI